MPESDSPLEVQVTASTQIFPDPSPEEPITAPLSIVDCTVSYFARCAGIWLYDPPASPESTLSIPHLQVALSKTLNSYRPWTGRLSYVVPKQNEGHTKRYRRVQVTYNAPTDLGVTFVTATSPKTLSDFLPSPEERRTALKLWDGLQFPSEGLLPQTRMALSSGKPPPDAPNLIIQITTFACGSTSIGIAITHGLSDAQSMCTFLMDWASISRALHSSAPLPSPSPLFDPHRLDAAAAGDIDAEFPDPALIEQARKLPLHRFDWYKEVPNQPWPVHTPEDFDHTTLLSPSDPIPWEDWDTKAPVAHRVLHFSAAEIQHIHNLAQPSSTDPQVSKHDALLAHIWTRINLARQLPASTTTYLNLTFGLRPRLSLPQNFLGSPIMITAIPTILSSSSSSSPPPLFQTASTIRTHLQAFTRSAIAAVLHDAAYEVSPQRLWRAFLGRKHVLQTTWVGAGATEVHFIGGSASPKLRFVKPEMGGDGLVLVIEGLGENEGHWTANGADVMVYLEKGAMERLESDEGLWGGGVV